MVKDTGEGSGGKVSKLMSPKTTKALKDMEENMAIVRETAPLMKEWQQLQAGFQRVHYEALIEEGFSETQALEIVIGVQHEPEVAI